MIALKDMSRCDRGAVYAWAVVKAASLVALAALALMRRQVQP